MATTIRNQAHYDAIVAHAAAIGLSAQLAEQLERLEAIAGNLGGDLSLGYDFAPYSLTWAVVRPDGSCAYNGGLIFHGPHDRGGDGGSPTYSVSLSPAHGWQIHS